MSRDNALHERVATIEQRVAELERRLGAAPGTAGVFGYPVPTAARPTNHDWRDLIIWAGASSVPSFPSPRTWPTQTVTVESHGAAGDGAANDRQAFLNAITQARNEGKALQLGTSGSPGTKTYRIDGKQTFTGWNSCVWFGNNNTVKAGPLSITDGGPFFVFQDCIGMRMYDVKFDGNGGQRGRIERYDGRTVATQSCHDTAWVQCEVNQGSDDGWYILSAGNPVQLSRLTTFNAFLHCKAANNGRNGISVINSHTIYIIGGVYRAQQHFSPAAGIDFEPNKDDWNTVGAHQIRNAFVLGVTFEDNYNSGLQFAHMANGAHEHVLVQDCLIQRNGAGLVSGTAFGWNPLAPTRMINGVFRHNMIKDHTGAFAGNQQRSPGCRFMTLEASLPGSFIMYEANQFPGPYLFEDNYFRNNTAFLSGGAEAWAPVHLSAHPLIPTIGGLTIRDNKFDLRSTPSNIHATNFPNNASSVTNNAAWRDAGSHPTPFAQNAAANTVITGTPPW